MMVGPVGGAGRIFQQRCFELHKSPVIRAFASSPSDHCSRDTQPRHPLQLPHMSTSPAPLACRRPRVLLGAPVRRSRKRRGNRSTRAIEFIVGVSPGGGIDRTARLLHERAAGKAPDRNQPPTSSTSRAAAARWCRPISTSTRATRITSKFRRPRCSPTRSPARAANTWSDFTPIAMLCDEFIGVVVKADSPLKDGRDLAALLRKRRRRDRRRHRHQRRQHQPHHARAARQARRRRRQETQGRRIRLRRRIDHRAAGRPRRHWW